MRGVAGEITSIRTALTGLRDLHAFITRHSSYKVVLENAKHDFIARARRRT
jgi:hypothetical protein